MKRTLLTNSIASVAKAVKGAERVLLVHGPCCSYGKKPCWCCLSTRVYYQSHRESILFNEFHLLTVPAALPSHSHTTPPFLTRPPSQSALRLPFLHCSPFLLIYHVRTFGVLAPMMTAKIAGNQSDPDSSEFIPRMHGQALNLLKATGKFLGRREREGRGKVHRVAHKIGQRAAHTHFS